ncbi:FimV/HubP family polar landmark protein [Paraburkholderia sp. DHOC27]|uniref:FimV/HubP family polar landmark protein n=1 Tax=Paraburkholderia sp. DHOC27 TaxID=2303330 RepID=UPI000E3C5010|nr:FimV/HubP family polar landmark protein [Paraburkholderia sp. DHOC27]RFU48780.1 hypothetical protein D0B32_02790 [Paraburkholderia sp. DHOC27]
MTARLSSYAMPRHSLCQIAAAAAIVLVTSGAASAAQAATTDAASAPVGASAPSAPLAAGDQYTIHPGQSLNDVAIAATQSHDRATLARASRALFDANPNAFMGHDPSRLRLGSVLTIPALDATGAAVAASDAPAATGASGATAMAGSAPAQAATAASSVAQTQTLPQAGAAAQAQPQSQTANATQANTPNGAQSGSTTGGGAGGASEQAQANAVTAEAAASASSVSAASTTTPNAAGASSASADNTASASPASATRSIQPPASAPAAQPAVQVSSLQQLLTLKSRVLMELQKHGLGGGNAAQPSSAGATAGAGNGAVSGSAAANGGAMSAQPATGASPDLSPTNLGIAGAVGAALVAVLAGLGLRRRKRAAAAAEAQDAAVSAHVAASGVGSQDGDETNLDAVAWGRRELDAADADSHSHGREGRSPGTDVEGVDGTVSGKSTAQDVTADAPHAFAASAYAVTAYEATADDATTDDAAARDAEMHESATHDVAQGVEHEAALVAAREASAHETDAHDVPEADVSGADALGQAAHASEHEAVAHEAMAEEAPAYGATADEAVAHDVAAHESGAHEATSHEAIADEAVAREVAADEAPAQDVRANDAEAYQAEAHEAAADEPTAHDATADEAATQEVSAHDVAADDSAVGEAAAHAAESHDAAAHEPATHEGASHEGASHTGSTHEAAAHEAESHEPTAQHPATSTDAFPTEASLEAPHHSEGYDPAAFPVNRPLQESAYEPQAASVETAPASFEHTSTEETLEQASSQEVPHASDEQAASAEHPTWDRQTQTSEEAAPIDPVASDNPTHDASEAAQHSFESTSSLADSSEANKETASALDEAHDEDHTASRWGIPEAFPLPEPLDPFPAELSAPKGFLRDAVDAFSGLDLALPPRTQSGLTPHAVFDTHPVAEPQIAAQQAIAPLPAPPHVADEITAGTAGSAAVAGLGAARFGALNLDFDLELPPGPSQPVPLFTPEDLGRIARNKLDLASEYIELGDLAGARALIHEVIEVNDTRTRTEARALLSTLAPLS